MKVILKEAKTGLEKEATIVRIKKKELPLKKDGWQF